MFERSKTRERLVSATALGFATALAACSGGGGGGTSTTQVTDPVITVIGPTGTYSMTPEEANLAHGSVKPPPMPPVTQAGQNQFLRLEVPFAVRGSDILSPDPVYSPFSQLVGNLSLTDETGQHVPGIVMVNGIDAFGKYRGNDVGFPHDLTAGGQDRNLGPGVILYVADDGDRDLSTIAAFGGSTHDSDARPETTDLKQLRLSLNDLGGRELNCFWTVTIDDGTLGDKTLPTVLSLVAETPDPADPLNPAKCAVGSRFILRLSEPCVPSSVGKSATLDPLPFLGNLPLIATPPSPPLPPLPHTYISATLNSTTAPLYLPCDVTPLNSNNLATYIVTPLVTLPPTRTVQLVVVDAQANQNPISGEFSGPIDLSGNFKLSGDFRATYKTGAGRAPVNAPVSPEVFYWLPVSGRGVGAVDLDGWGITTNTPGKWDNTRIDSATGLREYDPDKSAALWQHAAIATKNPNVITGIAILGTPSNRESKFAWPLGLGSYLYGPALSPGTPDFTVGGLVWQGSGANDKGNSTGTPIPGVNEMSSGFETMVRNAAGETILTGPDFGDIGSIADLVTGEFLDAGIFDTQNIFASASFHSSFFWGAGITRNNIGDPPAVNPPPSRFWVGLNPIDILIDQSDPMGTARLIEGDEVWSGTKRSYTFLLPNLQSPTDVDLPPYLGRMNGAQPQTASATRGYAARQQIGNYLYAVDTENKALQVLNSNTFQTIASISLPDPAGVAVMPNNRYVFTSNAGDDSMSIIGADPTQVDFHKEVAHIQVGRGPSTIACEPDGEDVFVVNSLDNTISIVQLKTLTVRKTLTTLIDGPRDVVIAPRQGNFGWASGTYYAYIANFTGNNVVVYESGPDGPQGIGCNNVLGALPSQSSNQTIIEPRGMCYSPYPDPEGLYAGGVFVAHRDENGFGLVTHIQFTHQALYGPLPCVLPPGRFYIPPGFNVHLFDITGRWGDNEGSRLIGSKPSSVVLTDFRTDAYRMFPSAPPSNDLRGTPGFGGASSRHPIRFLPPSDPRNPHMPVVEPDRMYVAFEDSDVIQVVDPIRVGVTIGTVEPAGIGVKKLIGYFDSQ